MTGKIAWADFDRMLDDMPEALPSRPPNISASRPIAPQLEDNREGPLMGRYSKALRI